MWRQDMPSCFGKFDRRFCGHPIERQHARAMLKKAIDAGASYQDIISEAETFLKSVGANQQHINTELDQVKRLECWFD